MQFGAVEIWFVNDVKIVLALELAVRQLQSEDPATRASGRSALLAMGSSIIKRLDETATSRTGNDRLRIEEIITDILCKESDAFFPLSKSPCPHRRESEVLIIRIPLHRASAPLRPSSRV